jgi:hypothetical protein
MGGGIAVVKEQSQHLFEGLALPDRGRASVFAAVGLDPGCGQALDGLVEQFHTLVVEVPTEFRHPGVGVSGADV